MPRRILIVPAILIFAAHAHAIDLRLVGQNIGWSPAAQGAASDPLTIAIANMDLAPDPDPLRDLLTGWQILLSVERVYGNGSLQFNSRALPAMDYLLDGRSAGLASVPSAANLPAFGPLLAFDDDSNNPPTGVAVPAMGKTLLALTFSTPDNALGKFRIWAHRGPSATLWSDAVPADRPFGNAGAGSFEVGTIEVIDGSRWNVDADGIWSNANNWLAGIVPNAAGAPANFTGAINSPRTVTVDAPKTVGIINFDNENSYSIDGANTLTLDVNAGQAAINLIAGDHTISAPVQFNKSTNITITPADNVLTISGQIASSAGVTLTKAGAGELQLSRAQADALVINEGKVSILANGTAAATSKVQTLTLAGGNNPTVTLDINNNAFVVDYPMAGPSPLATIAAQIKNAYHAGAWDEPGITSSSATMNTHGVGFAERSALTSVPAIFGGGVDATAVLFRLTRYGDASLDGFVSLIDFNMLAANFGTGTTWARGDFNYDGIVNLTDFNYLAGNFGLAAGPDGPTPADWAALASAIPEPATSLLFALATAAAMSRRRERPR